MCTNKWIYIYIYIYIYIWNRKTMYFECGEFIMMVKSALKYLGFIKPSSGLYDFSPS